MPLLGWAIWKARHWIPDAVIYVATEHPQVASYAIGEGCTVFPLTEADVKDQRDAAGPLADLMAVSPFRPVVMLDCTFPFALRSEIERALSDPRPFVRPVLARTLHLAEYGNTLSQDLPEQVILQSGCFVARRAEPISSDEWLSLDNTYPISWISSINIDTPEDLACARWLAKFIKPEDLDDTHERSRMPRFNEGPR